MAQCKAITEPNTVWPPFCPNLPASYLFCVLFGITFIAHVLQMFRTRKWYSWVIACSAGLQLATYILRSLSILHPANGNFYSLWFILMLIAPIFTNAYAYMVMGRMVYNFTAKGSVWNFRAWHFGLIFVLLDVLAFFIQVVGAAIASGASQGPNPDTKVVMGGLHVYMGGIGFQQACIFLFLALAGRFHMQLRAQPPSSERRTAFQLLYVEYAAVLLITVRIVFRLIEYSNGLESSIPQHEAYQYVFDSTLMLFALVLFNIFHPGALMPGKEAAWPKRKERKVMLKQGEMLQGRAGEYLPLGESAHGRQGSDVEVGLIPQHDHSRAASPSPFEPVRSY